MDGVEPATALDRAIEAVLRRDRAVVLVSLAAVVVLAWLYLWREAGEMDHAAMGMGAMPRAADPGTFGLVFAMWVVMMAGMMLPSAAPVILLYGALMRSKGARGALVPGVWIFAGAYLLVWTAFSALAALLQALLEQAALLTPAMASASAALSAAALIAAGVYQLTPLKQSCLGKCRNPLEFFVTRWRYGPAGAFRMGLEHGAHCVGCCWALMLLLFVAGVMNLLWVALIASFVFVEKLFPAARAVSRTASAALILTGLYLLANG